MEEFLTKIQGQFTDFFLGLDNSRKFGLIFVAFVSFGIMIWIVIWASKTQYEILYKELNKEDVSTVARLLEEKSINYLVGEDGKSISVPKDKVEIWRLELAKEGVALTGTMGYEVFDNQPFGTSSFVQKVNRQRALEGELIKTIKYLRGVTRARVHLNIPEVSPFVTEKKQPSASVVIELDAGVVLSEKEIRGIAHLVSSAVEGMRPEDVVIIDDRGKKLSDNVGDKMTADTANKMALQDKMSRVYENKIEEILGKVVGEGRVKAQVSVVLDFTETYSTETQYDGENSTVVSEVNNEQKLKGSRPSPQGIPGARSNLPGETPQPGIPETKNDVDKRLSTKNYNVPSKVIKSTNPTAKIVKITAAVMLDGQRVPLVDKDGKQVFNGDGVLQTKYEAWKEGDIKNFTDIVTSSIGLSLERGDSIVLKNMKFVTEDLSGADAMVRRMENRKIIRNIVKYTAVGLIFSLFFLLVVRPFIQWVTENTVESVEDFLPKTIEELEKVQADQKLPGLEDALPQIEERMNPEKIEGNMLREKIVSLVEANPSKAAQIIHAMIHSSGDGEKSIA